MKKLATFSFALALSFAQVGFAAADNSASNNNTGPDSENNASIEQTNDADINISNSANVNYNIKMNLNTGGNTVSHNTTAGDLVSGDIAADINLATEVNQNANVANFMSMFGQGGDNTTSNETTGPDSHNDASIKTENKLDVDIENRADVNYNLDLAANTGGNDCSYNTTVGDCRSGDINVGVKIATLINQGGVGGAEEEEELPEGGAAPEAVAGGVTLPTAAGGALFAAGSSLLLLLAMLFAAANGLYFLSRRNPNFAFHFLNEGKVGKGKQR